MPIKIGFIIIATNKYIIYLNDLLESIDKYCFLSDKYVVHKYILTNKKINLKFSNLHIVKVVHEPWPFITLKRFELIDKISSALDALDYIFYLDVDSKVVSEINDEILSSFAATIHPYTYKQDRQQHAYETNVDSMAYIPSEKGTKYFCGGFYGGEKLSFLNMVKILKDNIDIDLKKGIIARYHDESHLNKYLADNPPSLELNPGYTYPEEAVLPFEKKILALSKNHREIRKESLIMRGYRFLKKKILSNSLLTISR